MYLLKKISGARAPPPPQVQQLKIGVGGARASHPPSTDRLYV